MTGMVMLMNPNEEPKRKMAKKRKLTKKQQRYFGTKAQRRGMKRTTRRKTKRKMKRARAPNVTVSEFNMNPRGSKMSKKRGKRKMKRSHHRTHRRRFRRNPDTGGFLSDTLAPAAIGAGGAIAAEFLQGMIPLPQQFQQNQYMQPLITIGFSLLIGLGVEMVAGPKAGGEAAAGGIIVTLYNFALQEFPALAGQGTQGTQNQQGQGQGGQGYQQGGGMNRYLGRRQLRRINRQRMLKGLRPIVIPGTMRQMRPLVTRRMGRKAPFNMGMGRNLGPRLPLAPSGMLPRGLARGMGYTGPVRTLGRYLQR